MNTQTQTPSDTRRGEPAVAVRKQVTIKFKNPIEVREGYECFWKDFRDFFSDEYDPKHGNELHLMEFIETNERCALGHYRAPIREEWQMLEDIRIGFRDFLKKKGIRRKFDVVEESVYTKYL